MASDTKYFPEGPSTLRTLVPNSIKGMAFGTRNLMGMLRRYQLTNTGRQVTRAYAVQCPVRPRHLGLLHISHVCMYACMHACMYVRYVCMYACMYVCMHTYTGACICMWLHIIHAWMLQSGLALACIYTFHKDTIKRVPQTAMHFLVYLTGVVLVLIVEVWTD